MDTTETLYQTTELPDISSQLPEITSSITDMLAPFILLSFVVTGLFIILYVVSMVRKRKLENAILDIQKTLHEMNERDKARGTRSPENVPTLHASNEKIATKLPDDSPRSSNA